MDQRSNRDGEGHHQDQFIYHHQQQQQPASAAGRGTYHFPSSSSSIDHSSPSHSHPHIREYWFTTTQPLAEDNSTTTTFRSSHNFITMNEDYENEVRRRLLEHHQPSSSSSSSYFNSHSSHQSQPLASIEQIIEKEHMFNKVVTPSDVGKLNRLVIPKQHAEKYFPLDSSANEKAGLLLNFEDKTRKMWRFRYSYWNSSQSYVMTKGWSRFVKEKKLDAGDIVSFERGVGEAFRDRLFIDWRRRRPSNNNLPLLLFHHEPSLMSLPHHQYFPFHQGNNRSAPSSTPLYLRPLSQLTSGHHFPQHNFNNYNHYHHQQLQQGMRGSSSQTAVYLKASADEICPGSSDNGMRSMVYVPKAEGKKLRLFGVNMECDNNLPNTDHDESEILSSSSSPILPAVLVTNSPAAGSPHFGNGSSDSTSDPNERSQGNILSLNLSF